MFLTLFGEVAHAGVHLDAADLGMMKVHRIKGTDLEDSGKQMFEVMATANAETGLPRVHVNDAEITASNKEEITFASTVNRWTLSKIFAGVEALLALANLSAAQPIAIALTSKCILTMSKNSVSILVSYTPLGRISVPVPANTASGTYYLRATQNGLSWCSQLVDYVAAV